MKKEWILSDEEKLQKRAKIEENRAKKRTSSQAGISSSSGVASVDCASSSSAVNSPSQGDLERPGSSAEEDEVGAAPMSPQSGVMGPASLLETRPQARVLPSARPASTESSAGLPTASKVSLHCKTKVTYLKPQRNKLFDRWLATIPRATWPAVPLTQVRRATTDLLVEVICRLFNLSRSHHLLHRSSPTLRPHWILRLRSDHLAFPFASLRPRLRRRTWSSPDRISPYTLRLQQTSSITSAALLLLLRTFPTADNFLSSSRS